MLVSICDIIVTMKIKGLYNILLSFELKYFGDTAILAERRFFKKKIEIRFYIPLMLM